MWVDTSLWQRELDFDQLQVEGIIAKMSQGASILDPQFVRNYTEARARGIPCGAYHFLTMAPWQGTWIEQCLNRVGLSMSEPLPAGVGFAVDFEPNSITGEPAPPVEVLAMLCEALGNAWGRERVAIYSDRSRLAVWQSSSYYEALSAHPIWLAWPGNPWYAAGATLWQNDVRWIAGSPYAPIDINEVLDRPRMDRWFALGDPPHPGPTPEPIPPTVREIDMVLVFIKNDAGDADPAFGIFGIDLTNVRYFSDGDEVAELRAGSVPEISVTPARMRRLAYYRTKHGPGPTEGPLANLW